MGSIKNFKEKISGSAKQNEDKIAVVITLKTNSNSNSREDGRINRLQQYRKILIWHFAKNIFSGYKIRIES